MQVLYYDILSPFWSISCVSYRLIFYRASDTLKRHHYKTICSCLMTVLWITVMITMIQWLIAFEFFLFAIPATCRTCIKAYGCFKISPQILCSSSFPKAGTESPSLECRSHQRLAEVTVRDLCYLAKRALQLPLCFLFLDHLEASCHPVRTLKQSWKEIHVGRNLDLLPGASTDVPATWMIILESDPPALVKPTWLLPQMTCRPQLPGRPRARGIQLNHPWILDPQKLYMIISV